MKSPEPRDLFLAGAIEGFYGQPWSRAERLALFDRLASWGLNAYLHAPKDDLKHRARWREPCSPVEAEAIRLEARFEQMMELGCEDFALLFDDLPEETCASGGGGAGDSLASAQCRVANALFLWVRERRPRGRFLFCPTAHCGRMARRGLGGEGYLDTVGRELSPEIDVL